MPLLIDESDLILAALAFKCGGGGAVGGGGWGFFVVAAPDEPEQL